MAIATYSPITPAPWLALASFLAGMLKVSTRGAYLPSFPALLNLGVPYLGHATNTVARWPGRFTLIAYWRELEAPHRILGH